MITLSEAEINAFVKRRSKYYLRKFHPYLKYGFRKNTFNLGAFFFGILWLTYRKMWKIATILSGLIFLEMIGEQIIFKLILHQEIPSALGRLVSVLPGVICGQYGNRWYFNYMSHTIEELKTENYPDEIYLKHLSDRGGTSLLNPIGFILLWLVSLTMALAILYKVTGISRFN